LGLFGPLLADPVRPQAPPDLAELDLQELTQVRITVATGLQKLIADAPAVATVITAEQIEAMGATHLSEVLERVPGLHVIPSSRRLDPIYSIRGQTAVHVLIMLNGLPMTQVLEGGYSFTYHLPVTNIARIEVIRGPGSAIYGADAFAGVINVITKDAHGDSASELGLRFGSFDTQNLWLEKGFSLGDWQGRMSLTWDRSGGDRSRIVDADQQTEFDRILNTSASRAPGPLDTRFNVRDFHLTLSHNNLRLGLWNWSEDRRGLVGGAAEALDPDGGQDTDQYVLDVSHHTDPDGKNWEFRNRAFLMYLDRDASHTLFPPGALLPIGSDGNLALNGPANLVLFPDGLIANPGTIERTIGAESIGILRSLAHHRLRLGFGLYFHDVGTNETVNFGPGVIDGSEPVVDGTLTNVTDTPFIFMADQSEDQYFLSVQDEWSLTEHWEITAGLRYDNYSDFGGTFNPRLALVWKVRPELSTKLLYGSAFRAPSLFERYLINNPVALGNPNLEPETVDTFELVLDYRPTARLRTVLNIFAFENRNLIEFIPDADTPTITAQNANNQEGSGFEMEIDWQARDRLRVQGNYAWHNLEDKASGEQISDSPGRQLFFAVSWQFLPRWFVYTQLDWVADRERSSRDPRPEVGNYVRCDLNVRRQKVLARWDIALQVRNLFDESIFEPSDGAIPGDYPQEQRSFLLEMKYRW